MFCVTEYPSLYSQVAFSCCVCDVCAL